MEPIKASHFFFLFFIPHNRQHNATQQHSFAHNTHVTDQQTTDARKQGTKPFGSAHNQSETQSIKGGRRESKSHNNNIFIKHSSKTHSKSQERKE